MTRALDAGLLTLLPLPGGNTQLVFTPAVAGTRPRLRTGGTANVLEIVVDFPPVQ